MKKMSVFMIIFGAVMFLGTAAYADLIQGQVTAVDAQNKSVTITPRNAQDLPSQINLSIKDEALKKAQDQGISSLDQLSVGDEIIVEADKPAMGGDWKVDSLLTSQQLQGMGQGLQGQSAGSQASSQGSSAGQMGDRSSGQAGNQGSQQGANY
jgi:hypothetical protein